MKCSECKRDIPEDEWGYGSEGDWNYHVDLVQVTEDEMQQRLCGPRSEKAYSSEREFTDAELDALAEAEGFSSKKATDLNSAKQEGE